MTPAPIQYKQQVRNLTSLNKESINSRINARIKELIEAGMILRVKPDYGYGWSDGFQTIDTPDIFEISSDQEYGSDQIQGAVISPRHEFTGGNFEATLRYKNDLSTYNCKIEIFLNDKLSKIYTGYCQIIKE
ncbi:hypothetical protein [Asticcacaulis taihuensis]|uniref:hypothetical protein n=1 Tax=Asticcacaulis taihuensis TaxID=260084 RepID=UPI0026EC8ED9|nr:hypothetical protein [Asticcacaulis taihuensis]